MDQHEPYYHRVAEDAYEPTRSTESPWSKTQQHGGPPLALAAYAMLRAAPSDQRRPASVVLDFLGAIPLATTHVSTAIRRSGSRIDLLEANLVANGRPFAEVRLWRARYDEVLHVPETGEAAFAFSEPEPQRQEFFEGLGRWGYGESIEWSYAKGGIRTLGPTSVWTRVRGELVAGEGIDALARALVVADSANGVSAVLPMTEWLFVPLRIAVTLRRDPAGAWIRLDAETEVGGDGRAITRASMFDERGLFASVDQAVFVSRR